MVNRIPAKRILRLRAQGLSGRAIAASQRVARRSVAAVFEAADRLGVGWDDVAERDDVEADGRRVRRHGRRRRSGGDEL